MKANTNHLGAPQYDELIKTIHELLQTRRDCTCGRLHQTSTRQVIIASGALNQLPAAVTELQLTGKALLVADANTYQAAGRQAEDVLTQAGSTTTRLLLEPESGQREVEATDEPVQTVQQEAAGCDYLIAVGSGTINDIVKLASTRLKIPYLAVATAASMTGYSSGIAAIRSGAIKQTLPAAPPVAIVADIDIIASAPTQMHAAGVGDLVSRSLSSTDWKLSSLLRGDYFCPWIAQTVDQADQQCRAVATDISQGGPGALSVLTAGLILAGIAMKMAETSAPGSGGGHLISHYWDMTAPASGRTRNLHGLQVALGDLICAALYEKLWPRLAEIDLDKVVANRPCAEEFAAQTYQHYASLIGPEAAQQVTQAALSKYAEGEQLYNQLAPVVAEPNQVWQKLSPLFSSAAQLRRIYQQAGIPCTATALGISKADLDNAYRFASRFRDRYTILDLACDLGLLEELREEVFADAQVAR